MLWPMRLGVQMMGIGIPVWQKIPVLILKVLLGRVG